MACLWNPVANNAAIKTITSKPIRCFSDPELVTVLCIMESSGRTVKRYAASSFSRNTIYIISIRSLKPHPAGQCKRPGRRAAARCI